MPLKVQIYVIVTIEQKKFANYLAWAIYVSGAIIDLVYLIPCAQNCPFFAWGIYVSCAIIDLVYLIHCAVQYGKLQNCPF